VIAPVAGYEDLKAQAAKLLFDSEEVKSVILINCGSIVDVGAFLKLDQQEGRSAYVIDYHRPVHPKNIANLANVVVFADTETVPTVTPAMVAALEEDDKDGDDADDEHSSYGSAGESPQKRRRTFDNDNNSNDGNDDDDDNDNHLYAKDFSSGSYYGTSASYLMYELAAQESADTSHVLWLAILGVTEHYLLHRCSTKQYIKLVQKLRQAVVTLADKSLIFNQEEYQFVMYRHWSLYDSMYHSPMVATRLGIWSEGGRRRLDELFAKMGFPLIQCRQKYSIMNSQVKELLPSQLEPMHLILV